MKTISVVVELEYDKTRVSPKEVIFNVKRALDEYFNRYDNEYDEDALRVLGVNEDSTVLSSRD